MENRRNSWEELNRTLGSTYFFEFGSDEHINGLQDERFDSGNVCSPKYNTACGKDYEVVQESAERSNIHFGMEARILIILKIKFR